MSEADDEEKSKVRVTSAPLPNLGPKGKLYGGV
jgi:hypothetical protein